MIAVKSATALFSPLPFGLSGVKGPHGPFDRAEELRQHGFCLPNGVDRALPVPTGFTERYRLVRRRQRSFTAFSELSRSALPEPDLRDCYKILDFSGERKLVSGSTHHCSHRRPPFPQQRRRQRRPRRFYPPSPSPNPREESCFLLFFFLLLTLLSSGRA